MVMISLGADAEIDILSSGEFNSQTDELKRLLKDNRSGDRSIHKTIPQSAEFASDPLILDFGCAPAGTMWVPLWITLCGITDSQVVANATCAVYFGGDVASLSLANLLLPASPTLTPIPFNQQLGGKDAIYGHFGDHFIVVVHGAVAANQPIIGILRVREVHPAAVEELNTL